MTWIKVHQSVRDHRKIMALADALDVEDAHAVGLVVNLWLWAVDNAPDGQIPDSDRAVARGVGWHGDPHHLLGSLLSVGLVERRGDHHHIHDWDEYAGSLIAHRKREADRLRTYRAQQATVRSTEEQRTDYVHGSATQYVRGESRVEKNREEKNTSSKCIYTPDFESFWSIWPKKGDAKKPAMETWRRLSKADRDAALTALPGWLPFYASIENRIIPNATTWLNQARWENDPPPVEKQRSQNGYHKPGLKPNPFLEQLRQMDQDESVIESHGRVV
jgi:hypothetical protein